MRRLIPVVITALVMAAILAGAWWIVPTAPGAVSQTTHLYVCLRPNGTMDGLPRAYAMQPPHRDDQCVQWTVEP